jgi:hypothetical protein
MRTITLQYNVFDCACQAFHPDEYCEYCNLMCYAALEDFESGVGDWVGYGKEGKSMSLSPLRDHLADLFILLVDQERPAGQEELQNAFEEGHAPSPAWEETVEPVQVSRVRGETLR